MLHIEDLHVKVGDKEVLHDINLHIEEGETHVLLGPNGSGKTTLLMTIMGFTNYAIMSGKIIFKGEDVTGLKAHERAQQTNRVVDQRIHRVVRMDPQQEVSGDLLHLKGPPLRAGSRQLRPEQEHRIFSDAASNAQGSVRLYPHRGERIFLSEICPQTGATEGYQPAAPPRESVRLADSPKRDFGSSASVNRDECSDGTIGLLLRKFGVAWVLSKNPVHPGGWLVGRTLLEAKVRAETFGPGAAMRSGVTLQEKFVGAVVREVHLLGGQPQTAEAAVWVAAETRRSRRNEAVGETPERPDFSDRLSSRARPLSETRGYRAEGDMISCFLC